MRYPHGVVTTVPVGVTPVRAEPARWRSISVRDLSIGLVIVVAYLATARTGFRVAFVAEQVTTVWAPTGLAIASLLIVGLRLWPAIWLAAFIVNAGTSAPFWTAGIMATGNTLEALIAAWVLAFYIGHNFLHALFPQRSQEEAFAKRSFTLTPGTSAPAYKLTPVDGGYIARGKSSWNSGSAHGDWFMSGGMVENAEKPEVLLFMTPAKDVQVLGNWDVQAMRATSSGDVAINGAFVPHHHCVPAVDIVEGRSPGAKLHSNPLYSMPMLPLIQSEVLPCVVGAYQGAVREFHKLTRHRVSLHTSEKTSEKQAAQIRRQVCCSEKGFGVAIDCRDVFVASCNRANINRKYGFS